MEFQWTEVFWYIFPILSLIVLAILNKFGWKGMGYFSAGDFLHFVNWLTFHVLSLITFYFSLLPLFIISTSLLAIIYLFKANQEDQGPHFPEGLHFVLHYHMPLEVIALMLIIFSRLFLIFF